MSGWKFITTSEESLDIKYLMILASNDQANTLSDNYTKIKDVLAYTVGYYNNEPITMSVIQTKKIFNGIVRVLSRFYYSEGLDITHYPNRRFVRPSTELMLKEQIKYCEDNGYKDIFFSREDKTPYIMKRLCKTVGFNFTPTKYIVSSSYPQYIGWRGQCLLNSVEI